MRNDSGVRKLLEHQLFRLILAGLFLVFLTWPFVASPSAWAPGRVFASVFAAWALLIGVLFALSSRPGAGDDGDG